MTIKQPPNVGLRNPGPTIPKITIHIRNPNKGPRFLNQVPTLPKPEGTTGKIGSPFQARFGNTCEEGSDAESFTSYLEVHGWL